MELYKKYKTNINIILLFFLTRIPFILFLIKEKSISYFKIYDAIPYTSIAKNGYLLESEYAFFPLFPMLVRLLHYIKIPYEVGGILISNIALLISLFVLSKLINNKKSLYYLIVSPILVYTTICYTESLYILLTLLAFYYYKKNKYLPSAIFTGLSTLTRNSGIILWGAIGLEMLYRLFKKKDIKLNNIILFGIISLAIGMLYPIFLYIKTNDFLMFSTVQGKYWNKENGYVILTLIADIKFLINHFRLSQFYIFIENWLFFVIGIIIAIKNRKEDLASTIYIIVSLIAFTLVYRDPSYWNNLPSLSLVRYILGLFPIYMYLPNISKKNNILNILLVIITIMSFINIFIVYSNGFVA